MPIKDFIQHYPRALFNDIPRVGAYFYDIPGSGRTFTTYPGRAQFNDIPGVNASLWKIQSCSLPTCTRPRSVPAIDHLLTGTDSLVLGYFIAHHSPWHSGTTDTRGNQLADSVIISRFAVLNTDSPTRLPGNADPSSPDVSLR